MRFSSSRHDNSPFLRLGIAYKCFLVTWDRYKVHADGALERYWHTVAVHWTRPAEDKPPELAVFDTNNAGELSPSINKAQYSKYMQNSMGALVHIFVRKEVD